MNDKQKQEILNNFQDWFRKELAPAHKRNTLKLTNTREFAMNPFLWGYLSHYLSGKADAETLAKVLVYPRVLGTSINTSFGTLFQKFLTKYFKETTGSQIPGIDIEFVDKLDMRKKYCQIKSGPNVINYDDVETIHEHFRAASRRARTNNEEILGSDYMFCILYGEEWQKNQFIRSIEKDHTVVIGQEFWERFTGDANFYSNLIETVAEVANEFDMTDAVNQVIKDLAANISKDFPNVVEK